ncbi:MAG: DUF4331 family protein [Chloroflexota bacterium]
MIPNRRGVSSVGLLALAGLVATLGAGSLLVSAADHLDAPTTKLNHQLDITDLYAFKSSGGTTLILNVNPLTSPADSKTARFSTTALYQFNIDTNHDAFADIAYRVKFSNTHTLADGTVVQDFTIRCSTGSAARSNAWIGGVVATGHTTGYKKAVQISHVRGGGRVFAGVRDDPFFFDLPGFVEFKHQLLAGSTDLGVLLGGFTGTDTFAGTNVSSIAIEVPNARLGGTGRNVGVWSTVLRRNNGIYSQVERMGRPAINTVFNNTSAEKEAANRLRPSDDRAFDRDNVIATFTAIDHVLEVNSLSNYSAIEIAGLAKVLTPDTLTIKLGDGHGFLNGRKLGDDVIDAEFGLLTHGNVTSDGVNANDRLFRTTFPFIAGPH